MLTNDRGYVELVRNLTSGKDVVIVPKLQSYSARPLYEAEHAKVGLDAQNEVLQRVQAVLEADGSGSVSFLKLPFYHWRDHSRNFHSLDAFRSAHALCV